MNAQILVDIIKELLFAMLELGLPLLATALAVGLLVSIFQAATQINESTLSFLPKMGAILAVLMMLSPWMIRRMSQYTLHVYNRIPILMRIK